MPDWAAEYTEEQARILAAHITRTQGRLDALAERYTVLRALLVTGRTARAEVPTVRPRPGPASPLRLDILDALGDIDRYLSELLPLIRGALRLGQGAGVWAQGTDRAVRNRAALAFIANALARVYAEDPVLGDDVARGAWHLERRTGWMLGETSRPFALAEPCPDCGIPALWVVPDKMVIRCGNPGCGAQRPVDAVTAVTDGD
jgi:hypothetical protein